MNNEHNNINNFFGIPTPDPSIRDLQMSSNNKKRAHPEDGHQTSTPSSSSSVLAATPLEKEQDNNKKKQKQTIPSNTSTSTSTTSTSTTRQKAVQKSADKNLENLNEGVKSIQSHVNNMNNVVQMLITELEELKQSHNELRKAYVNEIKVTKKLRDEINGLKHCTTMMSTNTNNANAIATSNTNLSNTDDTDGNKNVHECANSSKQYVQPKSNTNNINTTPSTPYNNILKTESNKTPKKNNKTPTRREQWEENYERLAKFQRETGHCRITQAMTDCSFYSWISRQRHMYKLWKTGKKVSLDQDKIDRLNSIGFVWNVYPKPNNTNNNTNNNTTNSSSSTSVASSTTNNNDTQPQEKEQEQEQAQV